MFGQETRHRDAPACCQLMLLVDAALLVDAHCFLVLQA
jgi:hypothetical protein